MSEFTPTTQQVRDGYRYDPEDEYRDPIGAPQRSAEAGRAFDRWLDNVRAEAWEEGWRTGYADGAHYDDPRITPNPYRKDRA